ncbi:RICIN domain-containing protein [Plantactinospora siamensis]|uniref:RICIN domain-containing protein n=1 Tax=Plantactinospora siamensis TaxID=555372 RepID=A0ABV6P673_9ACTN
MNSNLSLVLASRLRRAIRSRPGRLIAATLLAGVAVAGLAVPAGAQPASTAAAGARSAAAAPVVYLGGSFHEIKNSGNGLCLEPSGQSTAPGVQIVQAPCAFTGNESLAQGWQFTRVGTNHYTFLNQLSGLCLNATDLVNGGAVIQWPCSRISNQEFNIGTSLPAVAKIESRIHFSDSGFCVDVPGASGQAGLAVQLFRCNGTPAQIWVNGF